MTMTIHCPSFSEAQRVPRRHTGDGEDLSPPLSWSALPPGSRELALIVDDPDAPSAEPWVHWVIYGIPAGVSGVEEGVHLTDHPPFPEGSTQGMNSWDSTGYRGPAPPRGHGVHHYHFKLYALDAPLGLPAGMNKQGLMLAMSGHVLGHAELVGTYERPK